jgi:putative polyhydroxyalkanoate system protein
MPDIHITREHALGLPAARKLAFRWAEVAEDKLGMECTYEEGKTADVVSFTRSGANGELKVTKDRFVLDARLGLLLGAFKDRIETEIVKNLDELLAQKEPLKAFNHALTEHTKKHAPAKKPAAKKPMAKKA